MLDSLLWGNYEEQCVKISLRWDKMEHIAALELFTS